MSTATTEKITLVLPPLQQHEGLPNLVLDLDPITPREVLEQALSHLVDQKVDVLSEGSVVYQDTVRGWCTGDWFLEGVWGTTRVCSYGAMLLGRRLAVNVADDLVKYQGLGALYAIDPNFRRAVQLLHNQIKDLYPAWHEEESRLRAWSVFHGEDGALQISPTGLDRLRHQDGAWLTDTITSWNDQDEEWSPCSAHLKDPDVCEESGCDDRVLLHDRREHHEVLGVFEAAIKAAIIEEEMA